MPRPGATAAPGASPHDVVHTALAGHEAAELLLHVSSHRIVRPVIRQNVGDGNFHTSPVFDRNNPKEMAAIETYLDRLTKRAIAMEGTCTGEHGVGQGKAKYLKAELGDGLAVMRAIKTALDPLDILNPGKIFLPA